MSVSPTSRSTASQLRSTRCRSRIERAPSRRFSASGSLEAFITVSSLSILAPGFRRDDVAWYGNVSGGPYARIDHPYVRRRTETTCRRNLSQKSEENFSRRERRDPREEKNL